MAGHPDVYNALKELAAAGAQGQGRRTQKHGERYPTMLLVALDLTVVESTHPEITRAYAWVKLVKCLASLRADDTQ